MSKTFARLDDMLFDRLFQPVSDLIVERIDVGRAAVAGFCVDIASLCWIISRAAGFQLTLGSDTSLGFNLALLLLGLVALLGLRVVFRRAAGRQANPLRAAMRLHRAVVLLMLFAGLLQLQAPGLADAADIGMLVFAGSALYLGACAERPPVRQVPVALMAAAGKQPA